MEAIFYVFGKAVGRFEIEEVKKELEFTFDEAKSKFTHDVFDPVCKNFNKAVFIKDKIVKLGEKQVVTYDFGVLR